MASFKKIEIKINAKIYRLLKAAIKYITLLENSADGYYRVEETAESKAYHKKLKEFKDG